MWGAVLLQLVVLGQGRGYGQRGGTEEKVKNFQVGQEGGQDKRQVEEVMPCSQELYEEGREAYLDNSYRQCVTLFEAALRDYRLYTSTVVSRHT